MMVRKKNDHWTGDRIRKEKADYNIIVGVILMRSNEYKTFKQVLGKLQSGKSCSEEHLPQHENIRGKGFYK